MNSSKLKLLLIVMFLAINIFFVYQYKTYSDSDKLYSDSEMELAVKILAERGVVTDIGTLPEEKTVPSVLKLAISDTVYEKTAKSIMTSSFARYVIPNGVGYTNERETLSFYDEGTFEYALDGRSDFEERILEKLRENPPEKSAAKYAEKLSDKLFAGQSNGDFSLEATGSFTDSDGILYIGFVQKINSVQIDKAEITVALKDGSLIRAEGTLFFAGTVTQLKANSLDALNFLFTLSDCEIKKIELIYYPVKAENGDVYMAPSYKITFADGEESVYDATSCTQRY